jgi:hypothetical protein
MFPLAWVGKGDYVMSMTHLFTTRDLPRRCPERRMDVVKRKRGTSPLQNNLILKKPKVTGTDEELLRLLDFSALNSPSEISDRFGQIGNALLHNYILTVRCGEVETEFRILELEFYLQKQECHEDPFTHGSEEQKICGRWYVLIVQLS